MQEKEGAETMIGTVLGIVYTLLSVAVMLMFIDGETGWLLLYTIGAALIASVVLTAVSRNHVELIAEEFSGVSSVGEKTAVRLKIRKKGFCFVPFVTVSGVFSGQRFEARASLIFNREQTIDLVFKPIECGMQAVRFSEYTLSDFFGLAVIKRNSSLTSKIAVLPRIIDYSGPEVTPSFYPAENEQREEGTTVLFGGSAGYEHRDYAAGDSPRRINYKLSAKKRRLMVRMDESGSLQSTNIVLMSDADGACAEQALALAKKLVSSGATVTVIHGEDCFEAALPGSVDKLREWLAFRELGVSQTVEMPLPDRGTSVAFSADGIRVVNAAV